MTAIESEEVNRKVKEFLEKGLIKESLSLCVILTMLAPNKGGE